MAGCFFFLTRRNRSGEIELLQRFELLDRAQERAERMLREEMSRGREENAAAAKTQREELTSSLESVRAIVDSRLQQLQEDNSKQIDKMRATVDEKLQGTLEKRLGESFKLVSDRLEQVHQGLGAMQQLASDVGGLQKVLSNVKMRGGWGEVQLGALLEQVLTPEQFARNVKTRKESGEHVDFAIKLPGDENGAPVWLPIDAKFPTEDYQRLVAAQEKGDVARDRRSDEKSGNATETQRERYLREVHQSTADDRFRAHVSADGRIICGSDSPHRSGRTGAARLPRCFRRTDNAGGAAQQFADGISHARDPETVERSLESCSPG